MCSDAILGARVLGKVKNQDNLLKHNKKEIKENYRLRVREGSLQLTTLEVNLRT